MKMSDLKSMLSTGKTVDIEFKKGIEDIEGYTEPGMRATILAVVDSDEDVVKMRISYQKYDEYNKVFESRNYWGRLSNDQDPSSSNYTARETGWYEVEDVMYLMADDEVEKYMTIIEPTEMFETWNASLKEVSYVTWLENRVRLLEKQLNSVDSLTQSYDNGHIN